MITLRFIGYWIKIILSKLTNLISRLLRGLFFRVVWSSFQGGSRFLIFQFTTSNCEFIYQRTQLSSFICILLCLGLIHTRSFLVLPCSTCIVNLAFMQLFCLIIVSLYLRRSLVKVLLSLILWILLPVNLLLYCFWLLKPTSFLCLLLIRCQLFYPWNSLDLF